MPKISVQILILTLFSTYSLLQVKASLAQDTISPPAIGQETKGTPAVDETAPSTQIGEGQNEGVDKESNNGASDSIFGNATITESRRESGQLYMIELEHSAGSKQYIEETGSDTKIESTSNDIEETPNLPKWKIGSW